MSDRQATANAMFDFITESSRARDNDEVLDCLGKVAKAFGMDCYAISGIPLPTERIDPYFMLNAWPKGWFERYVEENYVHVDPVIYRTKMSNEAFVWSEALADKPISRTARRVMNEATEFGMLDGYSVPLHSVGGFQAIVTFGARKVELSNEQRGALHIVSIYAHNRLRAFLTDGGERSAASAAKVTPREREVILWCSAGKTNWEIGQILGISEKTVQHEIASAIRKLNSVNRAQLIAESIRLGIIR
ncbi:MAG: LuxR family transcriptional regulator [Rhizobium sp.]|nr:LuxR family transcriptional regulator [Rhizobium sp.]